MSWELKKDYCGLGGGASPVLKVKSANKNASSQFLEKLGQDGAIAFSKLYGDKNASPSNEYTSPPTRGRELKRSRSCDPSRGSASPPTRGRELKPAGARG